MGWELDLVLKRALTVGAWIGASGYYTSGKVGWLDHGKFAHNVLHIGIPAWFRGADMAFIRLMFTSS
jgi:hypothetical protein